MFTTPTKEQAQVVNTPDLGATAKIHR